MIKTLLTALLPLDRVHNDREFFGDLKGDILSYIFKTLLTALLPVEHVHDDRDVAATKVNIHLWTLVLAWTLMLF